MDATMTGPATKQSRIPKITAIASRRRRSATAEVRITLPARVMQRLRDEARDAGVPLAWMVAAFVAALEDAPPG